MDNSFGIDLSRWGDLSDLPQGTVQRVINLEVLRAGGSSERAMKAVDLLIDGVIVRTRKELAFEAEIDRLRQVEPHPDAPLKLETAVCLPELGGVLRGRPEDSVPSPTISVSALRKATKPTARVKLAYRQPGEKNIFVTRRGLQEWLAASERVADDPPENIAADIMDEQRTETPVPKIQPEARIGASHRVAQKRMEALRSGRKTEGKK